ncbi:hypothetical protein BGZ61DRAFT_223902 [Ilyonectria robusta]|uniref:uncharacterized protein n=1 Tax=Ilyonectria robusta TaxID=1079257 RepID=UPI001E8E87FD|nr:uncharacterized protein BGZ61DRAFT_223902 [Ilyonectria robusta]KAH8706574.1 hypothetical protein BGZ61DRAFT_223902 [Ilyonectria robusta]
MLLDTVTSTSAPIVKRHCSIWFLAGEQLPICFALNRSVPFHRGSSLLACRERACVCVYHYYVRNLHFCNPSSVLLVLTAVHNAGVEGGESRRVLACSLSMQVDRDTHPSSLCLHLRARGGWAACCISSESMALESLGSEVNQRTPAANLQDSMPEPGTSQTPSTQALRSIGLNSHHAGREESDCRHSLQSPASK